MKIKNIKTLVVNYNDQRKEYIQSLKDYFTKYPNAWNSDDEKISKARQALRAADNKWAYDNFDHIEDDKKKQQIIDSIHKGQENFIKTAAPIAAQLAMIPTIAAAAPIIVGSAAGATTFAGGILGGTIGRKAADVITDKATNGRYNTFANWSADKLNENGYYWASPELMEYVNPGTLVGGFLGGVGANYLGGRVAPRINFARVKRDLLKVDPTLKDELSTANIKVIAKEQTTNAPRASSKYNDQTATVEALPWTGRKTIAHELGHHFQQGENGTFTNLQTFTPTGYKYGGESILTSYDPQRIQQEFVSDLLAEKLYPKIKVTDPELSTRYSLARDVIDKNNISTKNWNLSGGAKTKGIRGNFAEKESALDKLKSPKVDWDIRKWFDIRSKDSIPVSIHDKINFRSKVADLKKIEAQLRKSGELEKFIKENPDIDVREYIASHLPEFKKHYDYNIAKDFYSGQKPGYTYYFEQQRRAPNMAEEMLGVFPEETHPAWLTNSKNAAGGFANNGYGLGKVYRVFPKKGQIKTVDFKGKDWDSMPATEVGFKKDLGFIDSNYIVDHSPENIIRLDNIAEGSGGNENIMTDLIFKGNRKSIIGSNLQFDPNNRIIWKKFGGKLFHTTSDPSIKPKSNNISKKQIDEINKMLKNI